jgi:hypothetical protein
MDHERLTPYEQMYLQSVAKEMRQSLPIRLRKEGEFEPVGNGERYWEPNSICIEAADEIERLQRVIEKIVSEMNQMADSIHQVSAWFHNENVPKSLNPDEDPF